MEPISSRQEPTNNEHLEAFLAGIYPQDNSFPPSLASACLRQLSATSGPNLSRISRMEISKTLRDCAIRKFPELFGRTQNLIEKIPSAGLPLITPHFDFPFYLDKNPNTFLDPNDKIWENCSAWFGIRQPVSNFFYELMHNLWINTPSREALKAGTDELKQSPLQNFEVNHFTGHITFAKKYDVIRAAIILILIMQNNAIHEHVKTFEKCLYYCMEHHSNRAYFLEWILNNQSLLEESLLNEVFLSIASFFHHFMSDEHLFYLGKKMIKTGRISQKSIKIASENAPFWKHKKKFASLFPEMPTNHKPSVSKTSSLVTVLLLAAVVACFSFICFNRFIGKR